ncbi:ROK family protein [Streptosporangium saharense]|uniref:Putative NBD/HSP70 family sugar kinase/biotin operon repressor n=1 Tax=Streptosporangium saharense TaxID=1706840 RepID=A0A7W7QV84_9ACTN|nr:ROK family transcriptional regulator [Streptosporangium saharense]MBB4920108.1 putative NBD/HSP70 family sugar kinase/biotin operon repressor [Streptosporangium saharense]
MRTATPQMARAINDRLALDLLLEHGTLTAPQLRALTGLSRPTVSDLIERLQTNGLIEVVGKSGGERRGPNARLYGIVAGRAHVAGVDIRRDTVTVTVADITGEPVGSASREIGTDGPRTASPTYPQHARAATPLAGVIAETVATAAGSRSLHAVVLGAPGMVNPHSGELAVDNGVPGWQPNLLQTLRRRIDAQISLENDVNLAAVAEHRAGSAQGREDFVLLWLDDAVGAAVTLGGRLRRGASGGAGEVTPLGFPEGSFCDLLDAKAVSELDQDTLAARIARMAFTAVAVLDPGLVVLGGETGRSGGEELAARVGEHLDTLSPVPTQVRAGTVEGNAILNGALFTALSLAQRDVFGDAPT